MDLAQALRTVVEEGNTCIGFKSTKKSILKRAVKLVVVASNCPQSQLEFIQKNSVPVSKYPGTNVELGLACGKPFPISTLGVIEAKGDVLKALK